MSSYGAALRPLWGLQEGMSFLNHGSFGATPLSVLRAQDQVRTRMEAQPLHFFVRTLAQELRQAAGVMAELVGAQAEHLVFVDNATTGVNAVLRSLSLQPGDRLVTSSHVYPAVANTMDFVAERAGAVVERVHLPCPVVDERWLQELDRALIGARLAVFDHVTSATGLVLPIERMVALARDRGVPVLIDGAHAPGLLSLNVPAIGAQWYTGNAHKWLCAPKGTAFLWAHPDAEPIHPTVISHGYGQGLCQSFDFVGTRDYSGWLSLPAVRDFWEDIGGLEAARAHNNDLAGVWAERLLRELGTQSAGPPAMRAAMASILLPEHLGRGDLIGAATLNEALWQQARVEVPITPHEDRLWMRVSAQVYSQPRDIEPLLSALRAMRP